MITRARRQSKIKEILQTKNVSNHEEFITLLAKSGIEITQATLSRDFAAMGVIKKQTSDGLKYSLNIDETGSEIIKLISYEILGVEHNESALMVKTLAGRAQGVAHFIDRLSIPEIMGTLGGDDSVLIIPKSTKYVKKIKQKIESYLNEDI